MPQTPACAWVSQPRWESPWLQPVRSDGLPYAAPTRESRRVKPSVYAFGLQHRTGELADVAICSYIVNMTSTGIRQLKDNLSRYIRRIEAGERIAITAHGRVVAELVPPGPAARKRRSSRFDERVAAGVIRPPLESGDPTED